MTIAEQATEAYFIGLPRASYVSDATFSSELDKIWAKQWLYYAHASELPTTGDYLVREILGESVVVVRADDGTVNAFLNLCRHRGYRICEEGPGRAKRLVCPYHLWSYDLHGHLAKAPSMPDGVAFDYAHWGLHRVQAECAFGFIFVCLDERESESIHSIIAHDLPEIREYHPTSFKKIHDETYIYAANWKIVVENFLECYHCPGAHPEFCITADLQSVQRDQAYTNEPVWSIRHPLKGDAVTASMDGKYVCRRLLGEFGHRTDYEKGSVAGIAIQPSLSVLYFYHDYAMAFEVKPLAIDETFFACHWFVASDAEEGVDYEVDSLIHVWHQTNKQDLALCNRTQPGVRSRKYEPGPLSCEREPGIRAMLGTYRRMMAT